jgi:hypothetical protein
VIPANCANCNVEFDIGCVLIMGSLRDLPLSHAPTAKDWLAQRARPFHHPPAMFVVTKAEAAAIRAVFEQEGELSAAVELRRLFPGITDNAKARLHARTIAGWMPLPTPVRPASVTRLHPRKER